MSILNKIFTNKEEEKKEKKSSKKVAETKKDVSSDKEAEKKEKRSKKEETEISSSRSLIKEPWISEKSRGGLEDNQYVFLVRDEANKSSIKEEVERKWGVSVSSVNIIRKRMRPKRIGGRFGRSKVQKKAIVKLKEGDKIDIYPV